MSLFNTVLHFLHPGGITKENKRVYTVIFGLGTKTQCAIRKMFATHSAKTIF
jgi:hypothetical protein